MDVDEDGLDDDNAGGGGGGGGVGGGGGADCGFYFPLNSLCRGARGRPPPPRLVGNPYAGVLIQVTLCV